MPHSKNEAYSKMIIPNFMYEVPESPDITGFALLASLSFLLFFASTLAQ